MVGAGVDVTRAANGGLAFAEVQWKAAPKNDAAPDRMV
jgi:hypothetical protein